MEWRRNRELLTRGYAQHEIANTLHTSQPITSRDIHYFQKEMHRSKEDYGKRLFEIYQKSFPGLDEVVKNLWTIID